MSDQHPTRKHPVHGILDIDGQPTIIFDTVCTKGRKPWLANPDVHRWLIEIWSNEATAWAMGKYVILPDHIHLFVGATGDTVPYENWVRSWKSRFTNLHPPGIGSGGASPSRHWFGRSLSLAGHGNPNFFSFASGPTFVYRPALFFF